MGLLSAFRKKNQSPEEDILEHICDLLNTKKTFSSYEKELGLDFYTYTGSSQELTKKISNDIRICLEQFEPRIHITEVQPTPALNRFFISFIIKFTFCNSKRKLRLSFHHQNQTMNVELEP
jgi:predicted component of type VI protein secretion system